MAYSADMKRLAMIMIHVDKLNHEQVCNRLKICLTTLTRWIKLNENNVLYDIKPRSRASRKIDDEALRTYIAKNPDAYLYEIADSLGVSKSGVHDALKRFKITYKKNTLLQREKRKRTG
jgi:transposase